MPATHVHDDAPAAVAPMAAQVSPRGRGVMSDVRRGQGERRTSLSHGQKRYMPGSTGASQAPLLPHQHMLPSWGSTHGTYEPPTPS